MADGRRERSPVGHQPLSIAIRLPPREQGLPRPPDPGMMEGTDHHASHRPGPRLDAMTYLSTLTLALLSLADPPTATDIVSALEDATIEAIARAQPSVVAIARIRGE